MPGISDGSRIKSAFVTPYVALRTGVAAADTAPNSAAPAANLLIDMTLNQSGDNNAIYLVPQYTVGAGALSVQLWMLPAALDEKSALNLIWIPIGAAVTGLATLGAITAWTGLRAAKYFIQVTNAGSSTWTLYTSNSAQNY